MDMYPTILIVDDEPVVLALLRRVMHELAVDYDVLPISDGATALAVIAQRSVVLVMTDYRMPDMDGVALTTAIKAAAPQCRVILTTGYATPEIWQRAAAAGADAFLPKPFPFHQLEAVVRRVLTPAAPLSTKEHVGG
jgi:DNA-binding NtrC family response regulator